MADDQLEQSRDQQNREERRQAAMISFWTEGDEKRGKVAILNRSLDPIYGVRVEFSLITNRHFDFTERISTYRQVVLPCARLEIPIRLAWEWASREENRGLWDVADQEYIQNGLRVTALSFVDAYGIKWVRLPGQFANDDYTGGASLLKAGEEVSVSFMDVSDDGSHDKAMKAEGCSGS
ncbi:hypothetical protein QQY66_15970 [Streptomyces sp. DG2A-72]|uniref:hypothetical protein n=1 Tax=Streptomyces sp. DG2A-72 TaxID=3051386 RepID=UPI00265B9868|nr:hypothetical protein [Streptomyces sp. DG2A-72]MDO0933115.1 hypothetical protein [Streptomyces sp. DG2A-72]